MMGACSSDDTSPAKGGEAGAAGEAGAGGAATGAAGAAGSADAAGAAGAAGAAQSAQVVRGQYIVVHVAGCPDCHTPRDAMGVPNSAMMLAGNAAFADLNPADDTKGLVPTPNLTPDMDTGLGKWTDAQIKNAFQNGIDADGKPLFSMMPYYVFHNMTDSDADAVVAYLRSLPAVIHEIPERQDLGFPVTQASPVPASLIPDTTLALSDPDYLHAQNGRYLAGSIGACMECHSQHDAMGAIPLMTDKLFQGNEPFTRAQLGLPPVFPATIYSANLTPATNGLAGWTPADVVQALHKGLSKDNKPLCPPMPSGPTGALAGLTDGDATDIGIYLTTLAPKDNGVIPLCVAPSSGMGAAGAGGTGN